MDKADYFTLFVGVFFLVGGGWLRNLGLGTLGLSLCILVLVKEKV